MVEYLREHASEVTNMLYAEWDMDKALSVERVEGRAEGHAEDAARMKADGVDGALIAKYTGLTAEEIEKL
jgi:predicted transposase/invertase (TIGR01784 family)